MTASVLTHVFSQEKLFAGRRSYKTREEDEAAHRRGDEDDVREAVEIVSGLGGHFVVCFAGSVKIQMTHVSILVSHHVFSLTTASVKTSSSSWTDLTAPTASGCKMTACTT